MIPVVSGRIRPDRWERVEDKDGNWWEGLGVGVSGGEGEKREEVGVEKGWVDQHQN